MSGRPLSSVEWEFLNCHRVAHFATVDPSGRPHVVPVCFVLDRDSVFIPLDQKPKRVPVTKLRRVRNLETNSHAVLLVDDYSDDWQRLAYVQVRGEARLLQPADPGHGDACALLRAKYWQYQAMPIDSNPVIRMSLSTATSWSWVGDRFSPER